MALNVNVLLWILQVQSVPNVPALFPIYSATKHALNKANSNAGLGPTNKLLGDFFVALPHWKFMTIKLGYRIKYRKNQVNLLIN